jgi:hypothetical protein
VSSPKSDTRKRPNWQTLIAFGMLIIALLALLFETQCCRGPQFKVSAIQTLAGRNAYEVTNYMIWFKEPPTSTLKLNMALEVTPKYCGSPLGEVQVKVKNKAGETVAHDSWKSLDKESKALQLKLQPDILDSLVAGQRVAYQEDKGNYVYPKADLVVEVSKASAPNDPMVTDTVTILNSPWYHFARAVPNFLGGDIQSVEVYIKGRNLGEPADFMILAETYEITDTTGTPYGPWPKLDWVTEDVGKVGQNAEFSARITLPTSRSVFEPGKCYAIKTFAIKKQNYAEFADGGWTQTDNSWKFGDWDDTALVCSPGTPTPTATATATSTLTPTPTSTPSPTPTLTPTPTPTLTPCGGSSICREDFGCTLAPFTPSPKVTPASAVGECVDSIELDQRCLASHISIEMTEKGMPSYGYSLWEVRVLDGETNVAPKAKASASSSQEMPFANGCAYAECGIDDDPNTRWGSNFATPETKDRPQTFELVFPAPVPVDRIELHWQDAYAKAYCVTVK